MPMATTGTADEPSYPVEHLLGAIEAELRAGRPTAAREAARALLADLTRDLGASPGHVATAPRYLA